MKNLWLLLAEVPILWLFRTSFSMNIEAAKDFLT